MHYIRFLKTPKVHVDGAKVVLKTVITVTTDLGETFYNDHLSLAATIRSYSDDGDVFLRRSLTWNADMRALPISIDITRSDIDWPACLHIGLKPIHADGIDKLDAFNASAHAVGIVSVWSEALDPLKGEYETGTRVERRFMPLGGQLLRMKEDTGDSIARHLWDGSLALTAYIDRVVAGQSQASIPDLEKALIAATFKRLNVIELGCGVGVVGLALAQTIPDCSVLLTDLIEVEELVVHNIDAARFAMVSEAYFASLDWERPIPENIQNRTFDIIVAAECVYNTDTLPPLVKTLSALIAKSPKAVVLIATKVRHSSEAIFFDLLSDAGFVEKGKTALPLPGQPGIGYGDSATQVDLYVFQGRNAKSGSTSDELPTVYE